MDIVFRYNVNETVSDTVPVCQLLPAHNQYRSGLYTREPESVMALADEVARMANMLRRSHRVGVYSSLPHRKATTMGQVVEEKLEAKIPGASSVSILRTN